MKKTKIDWCDCTVNPVVGCPRGCDYCYARKMNDRFKWVNDFSVPQFFPERLKAFENKNPKSVFINSMSDIAHWTPRQLREAIKAMLKNDHHKYIALTKDLTGYLRNLVRAMWGTIEGLTPARVLNKLKDLLFVGETITRQCDVRFHCINGTPISTDFINIEPILEPIDLAEKINDNTIYQLIVIGAETGNRKGKVAPRKEWIDSIVKQADGCGIAVFMKGSLREIMGADFRQDALIWEE